MRRSSSRMATWWRFETRDRSCEACNRWADCGAVRASGRGKGAHRDRLPRGTRPAQAAVCEGGAREVQQGRFHKGMALVKLQGVESISGAEELRGMYLAILPEERAELDADSFWVEDVIGLEAVTESGRELGKVTEVLRGLANDVWVTPRALIPAVREFVISVDLDARRIVVRDAEGLETGQG